ncbi:MAG TPA: sulfotransferase [Gaiellales bacterium]|nr:sulfotransferase [Gaiellales bacterium]
MTGAAPRPVIFIGGLHRSGTSVIHRCIAAHPDVSGFHGTGVHEDEGQHLQTVYPPAYRHGGPGAFAFDPAAHLTEASPLAVPANRAALLEQWSPHWDAGAAVVVEKSPPNLVRTRFLQALFPEAVFVLVARHPIAVAEATRKWRRATRTALIHHWVVSHRTMLADVPHLARVHVLRYEDFVADPGRELAAVFQLVGLPPQSATELVRAGINRRYFDSWQARTRAPLGGLDCRVAIRRFDAEAQRWGYSLRDPERLGPPPDLARLAAA